MNAIQRNTAETASKIIFNEKMIVSFYTHEVVAAVAF
jgi:hypothetical protein